LRRVRRRDSIYPEQNENENILGEQIEGSPQGSSERSSEKTPPVGPAVIEYSEEETTEMSAQEALIVKMQEMAESGKWTPSMKNIQSILKNSKIDVSSLDSNGT